VAIDYWDLAKSFGPGDIVQKYAPTYCALSPFVGRVTAVLPGIGYVDVQWPYGNSRESPEDLVKVNPQFALYLPPAVDFSYYPGWDATHTASHTQWNTKAVPPQFYKELSGMWAKQASEIAAYDEMWHRYASQGWQDEALRGEVDKFYRFARNTVGLLINEAARKTAAYWVAEGRRYRCTRGELDSRRPNCPKCGTPMRKTIYKMDEGRRVRLFACPKDLTLIKQTSLVGPEGQPVEW
jgi:hypothetical protein